MAMANEMQALRAELATLTEKVSALELELKVEREIGVIARRKAAGCRVCQRPPEAAEGHPALTDMEKLFCAQGHRFKTLSADQLRVQRGW
jgi:hypothetical protein